MTFQELMQRIMETPSKEWISEVDENTTVCGRDLNIRLASVNRDEDYEYRDFAEAWAKDFPDPNAYMIPWVLWYGTTAVKKYPMISVDGHRAFLPLPKLHTMEITREQFAIACIINRVTTITEDYFATYIRRFTVTD